MKRIHTASIALAVLTACLAFAGAESLKLHAIFTDHMVLQRDKPIKVWGWGKPGVPVTVKLGGETAEATAAAAAPVDVFGHTQDYAGLGRWEVTFPAREASAAPITLTVSSGDQQVVREDLLIGDVWVLSGQSNMAFPLGNVNGSDMEAAQAHLPLLRVFSIEPNEQATLQDDIRPEVLPTGGWVVSSPETARAFSAIGFVFGANIQRTLQIPIGLIKNARGGAAIESMVPAHKFDDHPLARRYAESIKKQIAGFDPEAMADIIWQREKARAKRKGTQEPARPDPQNLRSWNVPGKSPSDMASIHNGMFGVFKGFPIKGVLFHQGYNNAMSGNCRPQRYRVLTKLMVDGIREDFNDPQLPFAIIGFCAGGNTQNEDNFEALSADLGPYIREAQRLGLADVGDPGHTEFLPAYDVQVPGLHPKKKREHGWRAARWALSEIYQIKGVQWDSANLISAEPDGDVMVLAFDRRVFPDDRNTLVEGFSIAGPDGKFYRAHARHVAVEKADYWEHGDRVIRVWSPLVGQPVAVRYAWANSPMGNLKVNGHQDLALPSFRTDRWDHPESEDPAENPGSTAAKEIKEAAELRLAHRRSEEARRAVEILERIQTLGQPTKSNP